MALTSTSLAARRDLSKAQSARLRVLFLSRAFAGLKAGLDAGAWQPAGVPAIYRLLEGLAEDKEIDLLTVFCTKEPDARFTKVRRGGIDGIGRTVLLPYRSWLGPRFHRANAALNELEHATRILALAGRFRPHLVYATYANLLPATLLARTGHRGVVLRLMGVVPHHRKIAGGALPLFRCQLRSPFAHVVCTEDGSDPAAVLPKLLHPGVAYTVRLNGCDARPLRDEEARTFRAANNLGSRPVVAFVGRLESYKGCLGFIEAALAALQSIPDGADFVIVGEGPLRQDMQQRVAAAGQSLRFRFLGALPHGEVHRYVAACDVYVSTNMYGSLSNANLEALAAGTCLVLPTSDPMVPLDTVADALIPDTVACRYDRAGLPGSLADALCSLLGAPAEIAERRARTRALAEQLIKPWDHRIAEDIALLKNLVQRERKPAIASSRI